MVGDGDRCLHLARPAGLVAAHRPAELVVSGLPGLELAGHAQLVNASHHVPPASGSLLLRERLHRQVGSRYRPDGEGDRDLAAEADSPWLAVAFGDV